MTTEDVIQALTLACNQDPALLKVGEKQLEAWKPEKGFYSTLAVSNNYIVCIYKTLFTQAATYRTCLDTLTYLIAC